MGFFEWQEEYLTHIDGLDAQHQKLVAMINSVYDDLYKCQHISQKQVFIAETLKELIDYSCFHFEAEEKLMLRYEYPCYAVHKEEHEQFKKQIAQFVEKQKQGTLILAFPIFDFLKDWLISHVLTIDKQYGPYISEKMKNVSVSEKSLP